MTVFLAIVLLLLLSAPCLALPRGVEVVHPSRSGMQKICQGGPGVLACALRSGARDCLVVVPHYRRRLYNKLVRHELLHCKYGPLRGE